MKTTPPHEQTSDKDKLVTRPPGHLPTPLDPAGAEAHGGPKDPKPVPATGQGDPDAIDPAPDDIGRSA